MRNSLLLIALSIFTTSCFSHRGLDRKSDYTVNSFSNDKINGLYQNLIPGDDRNSLWQDLYKNKSHKDLIFNAERTQVELILMSKKRLKANLYRKGRLEDSIELKGKIRNGYFVINRRVSTFPLPIFFLYAENKTILGNDDLGNLILVQGQNNQFLIMFALSGGDSEVISARYTRL
ncbi:hypothetical protein [Nonlabens antarcticus]|uniref:hypothetical protein n=1 Tax=Nonlabens antarcticus TaxID=392714 RepID=UPI00189190C0|nr:hypothetical protein [Nonlabens antarcticus]